jgi:hypothetical protein
MLGVRARLGRLFAAEEERKDSDHVAVVTDKYSTTASSRSASNRRSVTLAATYTIVGVLPSEIPLACHLGRNGSTETRGIGPLSLLWNFADDESVRQLLVTARLKEGVSLAQAHIEIAGTARRLAQSDKKLDEGWAVIPFELENTSPTLDRALYVMLAAVGFLLLIAWANLAKLTLTVLLKIKRQVA